ncbi:MAG: biopolymer transporter ExbD [Crocinitomicaceae bacterium]|nr:biopolymer transporter ExbD [Crocinitomicaceae bacterium]|tara:strand:- start:3167 stop:3559 length:393 start_codon:yes stop_codon:yes gene_type:complete
MSFSTRNKINVSAGISSMTDLVFLLLIFFIIISTLVSNGVNVDLPKSKGTTSLTPNLTLSITADGTYHLNGGGAILQSDLENKLILEMQKQDEKVIYLQADANVPTGQTVEIIGLAKANQWKVMLGSTPK